MEAIDQMGFVVASLLSRIHRESRVFHGRRRRKGSESNPGNERTTYWRGHAYLCIRCRHELVVMTFEHSRLPCVEGSRYGVESCH